MMPPAPTTGMPTAPASWYVSRTAIGRTAGPESPPVTLASAGRRRSRSITIPGIVFITVRASAPAASAARPMAATSATSGLSLATTGKVVTARTARTTSAVSSASWANRRAPAPAP